MVTSQEYQQLLEQVQSWPPEVRLHFAQDVLRGLLPLIRGSDAKNGGTADHSAVCADDQLLLHMHRMEKYG